MYKLKDLRAWISASDRYIDAPLNVSHLHLEAKGLHREILIAQIRKGKERRQARYGVWELSPHNERLVSHQ